MNDILIQINNMQKKINDLRPFIDLVCRSLYETQKDYLRLMNG